MGYNNIDPKYLKEAIRDIAQICGLGTNQVAEIIIRESLQGKNIEEIKKLLIAEGNKVVYKTPLCKSRKAK